MVIAKQMKNIFFISIVIVCLLVKSGDGRENFSNFPVISEYSEVIKGIEDMRQVFTARYRRAGTPSLKLKVIEETRAFLVKMIRDELLPQWSGTPWDFNGTTETPRTGKIACGYFVTTILRDAGFKVQRVRLAQQPSELIIKSLTREKYIKRFSHASLDKFVTSIQEWGEGFYLVGLDMHTGFILHDSKGVWFIHASYIEPRVVLKESAQLSPILKSSSYRVIGKLSADDTLLMKWIQGQAFPTNFYKRVLDKFKNQNH